MNREDVAIDVTIQDKHPEQAGGDERAAFEQWEAEQIAFVLRQIGSMDADDIDNDNVDLRFEDASGRDTGCDVSIVDYAEKAASLIEAMLSDRAALAQPSQSQYEASFEEWLANELEGEDGQPVPAAFCDIALARRAFNHWPKLEHPAKVGGVRFSAGVSSRLVVEAAQRLYEFESTPEQEAERIERLQAFREQCFEPLGAEFSKVLSDNLPELLSTAQAEQAEAERPEVVAVRYEDGTILSAEECGIALEVCAKVQTPLMTVSQHERIVGALRAKADQLREALEWRKENQAGQRELLRSVTAERDAALARVVELERQEPVATVAKVPGEDWNSLDFHRDLQDMQPGTKLYAAPVAQAQQLNDLDKQCRDDVARALGLRPNQERGFAWSYLLASIKSCVKASVDSAQAQHSVPDGAADLCRFLAKLYCELDGLRYSTAKLPAEQIADALIFKWPVLQGARNQLNIKRISEQPYDESKLHSAIAAMLAALPGKEGV
ncbi:hypothetical protein ICI41_21025 [Pseudomonas aeruginosa]|uniref:hypothetical protein n=1 Tax=Pseudomonas aeruginosa TaxID=287 RepID=UPI001C5CEA09|nr:hypothetical protein [Pseudomonas aeruginosa]QWY05853.1 hypothetical protein ICI41_21025 [Pseudomonas aeruginosa]